MPYRKIQTFNRGDLLKGGGYSQIRANGQVLEQVLNLEHTSGGEHNTPLVARSLGTVLVSGGPTYSLSGFNSDVSLGSGHNPAVGKAVLTVASSRYEKDRGVIMVQNASVDGDSRPELTFAKWLDDRRIEVFTCAPDGTAYDSAFHIAIHGRALPAPARLDFGGPLQGFSNGLRAGTANKLIQSSADMQVSMDFAHTEGAHDCREVAKAWARVEYNGSTFDIADQEASETFDGGLFSSFDIASTGVINCNFRDPLASTGYQVFAQVGGTYFICTTPADERFTSYCVLRFWKQGFNILSSPAIEEWNPNNELDFQVWIFDDH